MVCARFRVADLLGAKDEISTRHFLQHRGEDRGDGDTDSPSVANTSSPNTFTHGVIADELVPRSHVDR